MREAFIRTSTNRIFHYIGFATAGMIYLLIVIGDFAQRTGVGLGYSEWLLIPTFFLILLAAILAWRSYREEKWISAPLYISVIVIVLQFILLLLWISPATSFGNMAAYLSSALLVHAMVLTSTVVAFRSKAQPFAKLVFPTPFAKLTLGALVMTFLSIVSGSIVTVSANECVNWFFCGGSLIPQSMSEWIHFIHRVSVGISGLLILLVLLRSWNTQRYQTSILAMSTASAFLFFGQSLIGAFLVDKGFPADLVGLHSASGAAVWVVLTILVIQVGLSGRTNEFENLDAFQNMSFRTRIRDFFILTKPVIMLLLLLTTFTGLVVGGQSLPSFSLLFWTLLGGAMAAGGSSAINQYIDRDLDRLMSRTAKRPIAARRLSSAEGLAFGLGLCLAAFYILVVFVNLLSGVLALFGMFYYVWIYSIVLKKSTVQNIVIGGGAGAVPPLVGWAAATGSLNLPALLLFAIIFFWTPPHFWALALVRIRDYSKGGVPMLPVVRGESETRKQILIYSLELVAITLLVPLVGIAGFIYLSSAVVLGAGLIFLAWKLWRSNTPKLAWRLYKYSSLYLGLLFVILVMDTLITY